MADKTDKTMFREVTLTRYALLCGSAPDGFIQKKIDDMHDFLISADGGGWQEREIMLFPNGVSEALLAYTLKNLAADGTERIFLYICTERPTADAEESVWLGGNEISKRVLERTADAAQVIYDVCAEFVPEVA